MYTVGPSTLDRVGGFDIDAREHGVKEGVEGRPRQVTQR